MLESVSGLTARLATWEAWPAFVLVGSRVAGLFVAAPFFRGPFLPWRLRVGVIAALALAMVAVGSRAASTATLDVVGAGSWSALPLLGGELVIGCALGWSALVVLAAVQGMAHLIAQQLGLSAAAIADPQGGGDAAISGALPFFYHALALFLFLALDLHLSLVRVVASSFTLIAPGEAGFDVLPRLLGWLVLEIAPDLFVAAVSLAFPVLLAMFVVSLVQAGLGRVLPEAELFTLGIPARVIVGLLVIVATLPVTTDVLGTLLTGAAASAERLLVEWAG